MRTYYSVPFAHAGALLELRSHPDTVLIYSGSKVIAEHPRNYGRDQDIDNPEHTSRLLKARKRGEDAAILALSPRAEAYFGGLRTRDLHALGQVRRILLLAQIHGRELVAAALEEAIELGAYGSDYLRNILRASPGTSAAPWPASPYPRRLSFLTWNSRLPTARFQSGETPSSSPL